jgi:hypothetical protein
MPTPAVGSVLSSATITTLQDTWAAIQLRA